jgi:hypothetical protein
MQAFEYKSDNKIVGLLHRPETGDLFSLNNMNNLFEILKNNSIINSLNNDDKELISKMYVSDEGTLHFNNLSNKEENNLTESLERIIYFYHNKLTQNVIVPQTMDFGPAIRHRPLYFGLGDDNKSIIVKYTTFGDFNNFDIALSVLKKLE